MSARSARRRRARAEHVERVRLQSRLEHAVTLGGRVSLRTWKLASPADREAIVKWARASGGWGDT